MKLRTRVCLDPSPRIKRLSYVSGKVAAVAMVTEYLIDRKFKTDCKSFDGPTSRRERREEGKKDEIVPIRNLTETTQFSNFNVGSSANRAARRKAPGGGGKREGIGGNCRSPHHTPRPSPSLTFLEASQFSLSDLRVAIERINSQNWADRH
ncbi:hypothetical protein GWI33_008976 [Rhynchophorus ferrugineus]|uniref:Uncharacterized protein n=1 Tax=Rhynchophorus ferrugineus TaxID=354439 RepID=A0A834IQ48_RHYFE|nr:hypothetical protein GWI33_008976 [Rhynchophorus ferrugineus]